MTLSKLPPPTSQGMAIIQEWKTTTQSLMVNAYAGTGKTTMLRQLAPNITEPRVLCLAFNKKNAEDLKLVMPERFTCATLNSIGHMALKKSIAKTLRLESDKKTKLIQAV